MGKYKQIDQTMQVSTPLGEDVLLLEKLRGREEVSTLFRFELDLLAESAATIAFDQLLGQSITVTLHLSDGSYRPINGIVQRFVQGIEIPTTPGPRLTRYQAILVPQLWLLTRNRQSRIFQQQSVPDILEVVFADLKVDLSKLVGPFAPRDYCVQYGESDFHFASRLMEEEGIFYYFTHTTSGHQLVLGNTPNAHADVPGPTKLMFQRDQANVPVDGRVITWQKSQEIRAGQVTLRDRCFELSDQTLQANQGVQGSVLVGTVKHSLDVGNNVKLELYDYPGAYAQRFDSVGPNGEDQTSQLQNIYTDGTRTANIRMEQETAESVRVEGDSTCQQLSAGCKFSLENHFNGDGKYVLTQVEHDASLEGAFTETYGRESTFRYRNHFQAIPLELPYRPAQVTPKPRMSGVQTALVVGNGDNQLYCDKYARVKVQFYWDRQGNKTPTSSCWIRVAQVWAGKGWGAMFFPRVGHEVVVAFEEGDIDQPLIVGSVYNSESVPPFELPENAALGGIKSCSIGGESGTEFNGVIFDDTPGAENLTLHGQNDVIFNSEADKQFNVQKNHTIGIAGNLFQRVGGVPAAGSGSGGAGAADASGSGSGGTNLGGSNWPPSSWKTSYADVTIPSYTTNAYYGLNLGMTTGIYGTYTLGSALQLTISPSVFFHDDEKASTLSKAFRGALGGSTNVVLGAATNFYVGPTYNIHYGTTVTIDEAPDSVQGKLVVKFAKWTAGIAVLQSLSIGLLTPGAVTSSVSAALTLAELGLLARMGSLAAGSKQVPTVYEQIDAAFNDPKLMPNLQTALNTLTTDMTTAKTDIGNAATSIGTLQKDLGTASTDLGTAKTELTTLANRLTFTDGNYHHYARNIFLVGKAAPATDPDATTAQASSVLVAAVGEDGQNNGNLVLLGTNLVSQSAGPAGILLQNSGVNNGTVTIAGDTNGSVILRRGPNGGDATQTIQIGSDGSILIQSTQASTLTLQTANAAISIQSGGGNITLDAGNTGTLTLNAKTISLTGTEGINLTGAANSSIALDNQGNVKIGGVNTSIQAETQASLQAMTIKETATATYTLSAVSTTIGQ